MISRRDVIKLGALGSVGGALLTGCGEEKAVVLDYPDRHIDPQDPNEHRMYRANANHTGLYGGAGPTQYGEALYTWKTTIYNFQRPLLYSNGTLYCSLDNSIVALDANSGARQSEYLYGSYDGFHGNGEAPNHAIDAGVLYFTIRGSVKAVQLSGGAEIWTYEMKDWKGYASSITLSNDTLYLVLGNTLVALDRADGTRRWLYEIKDRYNPPSPAFESGTVYLAGDKALHAIDSRSGKEKWTFAGSEDSFGHAPDFESPMVVNGRVFGATSRGILYALDESTGEKLWEMNASNRITAPSHYNGVVHTISSSGELIAVNTSDGSVRWVFSGFESSGDIQPPTVVDGVIYIVPNKSTWIAVHPFDGSERGRFELQNNIFNFPPLVTNGHVYMSWFAELYAVNSY